MKREIRLTSDGSTTLYLPQWDEQYHSRHGAIREAEHVFMRMGLDACDLKKITILEIGFGTGLNCFMTFLAAHQKQIIIDYVGVEAYPVTQEEVSKLNYTNQLEAIEYQKIYDGLHSKSWGEKQEITSEFYLTKKQIFFSEIDDENTYDLIYFDAFGAEHQPELWTSSIFQKMFVALKPNGILTTYAAKGSVRRAMLEVGFKVERLQGPPGKREMLRARKIIEQD
uniref:tRNA (5-methylaminomethyl-2-thiouridine)(34)-methyltransferase MnmD n=1 Tax=Polaribacter sp. TaxID=1920175 RepID=UPI0040472725